jgi:hypothetical protein
VGASGEVAQAGQGSLVAVGHQVADESADGRAGADLAGRRVFGGQQGSMRLAELVESRWLGGRLPGRIRLPSARLEECEHFLSGVR